MNWKQLTGTALFALAVAIGAEVVLIGVSVEAVIRGGIIGLAIAAGFAIMGRFAAGRNLRDTK